MIFIRQSAFFAYHHLLKRDGFYRKLHFLKKSQWYSKEKLKEYQHGKLTKLLQHAYNNVPYYNSVFRQKGISYRGLSGVSSLKRIPLLSKGIIRKNFLDLCVNNIEAYSSSESSTSGSTGESLFFLVDSHRSIWRMLVTFRHYEWCGVHPLKKIASLWGAGFDEPTAKTLADKIRAWARPLLFLSSYNLDEDTMESYANQMGKFRAQLLISYSSPLVAFADFCIEHNVTFPSLRAIICSGEQLFDYQRKTIEQAFNVPVSNRYGSREFGNIAQQCEKLDGMHINAERVYVEILDDNGNECPPGQTGELVITDLDNYVMPFIRYRIGDMASWSDEDCTCGRSLPLIETIEGRIFDIISTKSGKRISGTFWPLLLKQASKDIVSFQIRQDYVDEIIILLKMMSGHLSPESKRYVLEKIRERAPDLVVRIEYVNDIPLTRSGKRRFVVSNIN